MTEPITMQAQFCLNNTDVLHTPAQHREIIAGLVRLNKIMQAALEDVVTVLESADPAIADTVWSTVVPSCTLLDHCKMAQGLYERRYDWTIRFLLDNCLAGGCVPCQIVLVDVRCLCIPTICLVFGGRVGL